MKQICVFNMKRSNISFNVLKDNIVSNKYELTFSDELSEIPVEK